MKKNLVKGIYLSQPLTEDKFSKIIDLDLNEISFKWEHYNEELVGLLQSSGIKVYAEVSLFVGEELWRKYPDARPINRNGQPMVAIDWYHGVCPNHPKVQEEKLNIIESVIETYGIDGLWLDFIRYPCGWEKVRTSHITEYCFCRNCLEKYEKDVGGVPDGERWVAWKCKQITNFVSEVRKRIEMSKKPILLGLFAVPWNKDTYRGSIRSIICQDFRALSVFVDVFGVMAYHKLTENSTSWISYIVQKLDQMTEKSIIPLVQSMNEPETISKDEFEHSINIAIKKPSDGVIIFNFEDLLRDKDKFRSFKEFGNLSRHGFKQNAS